jgi:tRNA(Ile)-lysidine synthase
VSQSTSALIETKIAHALCAEPDSVPNKIAVAFSGGLDSMVLLHALSRCMSADHNFQTIKCYALHIHHGLSAHADQWLAFCETAARARNFIFVGHRVQLNNIADHGVEQAARQARYTALQALCEHYDITTLLAAHHQDDQAETILLQLLRGSGVAGLAAMPTKILLANQSTALIRPLLPLSRQQLAEYAQWHQLPYIEDESNHDQRYARNAIRHEVLPKLEKIRAGCRASLARSASLLAEAQTILDEVAQADLSQHQEAADCTKGLALPPIPNKLICQHLRQLSSARSANLVRYWLTNQGLRAPSRARLNEMLKQFLGADKDTRAKIQHDGHTLHLWREQIWLEPQYPAISLAEQIKIWRGEPYLDLPEWGGRLLFIPTLAAESGIAYTTLWHQALRITRRSGGERFRAHPKKHTSSLQHAYQQQQIPPWLRAGPLIYRGEQLIWVAYLGQNHEKNELIEITDTSRKIKLVWQVTKET